VRAAFEYQQDGGREPLEGSLRNRPSSKSGAENLPLPRHQADDRYLIVDSVHVSSFLGWDGARVGSVRDGCHRSAPGMKNGSPGNLPSVTSSKQASKTGDTRRSLPSGSAAPTRRTP